MDSYSAAQGEESGYKNISQWLVWHTHTHTHTMASKVWTFKINEIINNPLSGICSSVGMLNSCWQVKVRINKYINSKCKGATTLPEKSMTITANSMRERETHKKTHKTRKKLTTKWQKQRNGKWNQRNDSMQTQIKYKINVKITVYVSKEKQRHKTLHKMKTRSVFRNSFHRLLWILL